MAAHEKVRARLNKLRSRRKTREKLEKKGVDPDKSFIHGIFVGSVNIKKKKAAAAQ